SGPCCALLDARRDELFAAIYDRELRELCAPRVLPREELADFLAASGAMTVVGEVAHELSHGRTLAQGKTLDLPHARWVATLAGELSEASCPPEPRYVRGIGATLPSLPHSPIEPR
ncbi:MAG TPA: hypothetical protein VFK05_36265, partial [Polyangiaceae bacterium]|nr:hypothetical protein [Polyangiaceae bacterium]